MIDIVKGIEPDIGYGAILQVSEAESAMRESRTRKTKTVCTYCGVGCSFDIWTEGPAHPEGGACAKARPTAFPPASKASSAGITSTAPTG